MKKPASGAPPVSDDVLAGSAFIAFAAIGFWANRHLRMGSPGQMGPGYIPAILCGLLLLLGVLILAKAWRQGPSTLSPWAFRPLAIVLAAMGVYWAGLERAGLFLTTVAAILVAATASRELTFRRAALLAVLLAAFAVAVFVWGLNLPMPAWPTFPVQS